MAIALLLLFTPQETEQLTAALDPLLLQNAQRLDIVFVADKFSYLSYLSAKSQDTFRPAFPEYSVRNDPQQLGTCLNKGSRLQRKGSTPCGYVIPLDRLGGSSNLLCFNEVTVTGSFTGRWHVSFADDTLFSLNQSTPVASLSGDGPHTFQLDPLFDRADLSRSRTLLFLLDSPTGSARIDRVTLRHAAAVPASAPSKAVWAWNRKTILGKEGPVVEKLASQGIKKVYLQIADDPDVFAPFLEAAARQGIAVCALDGSPESVTSPQPLLDRVARIEAYNRAHPECPYAGFQTDMEPYLNKDFASRKTYYAERYITLLQDIKRRYKIPLSVVVPFWFDTIYADSKSLIQKIVQCADEIVVMSYRTDGGAVVDISRSVLSLGEQYAKPVWLGVELGGVPDERHVELERCDAAAPEAIPLGGLSWCRRAEYLVPGSRMSFRHRLSQLPSHLRTPIPFRSFSGWVLHSLEELP